MSNTRFNIYPEFIMKVTVNNISLNYGVIGIGEPLILIGGLTANCREWQRVTPYLKEAFTVYTPENRGAGLTTGWTSEFSVEDMADDISEFIDALGLEYVYVVGHSMGGAILQSLCIMYPQRVRAAVIASSFAHFPKAAQLYIENTAELLAAGLSMQLVLRTIYTRLYGSNFLRDEASVFGELQRMLTDQVPQTPEGYQAQVKSIAKFDTRPDLAQIECPVLILNGSEDVLTPTYLSEELHRKIKNSKLQLISECGHMLPQEKPEEFARCVLNFLAK